MELNQCGSVFVCLFFSFHVMLLQGSMGGCSGGGAPQPHPAAVTLTFLPPSQV